MNFFHIKQQLEATKTKHIFLQVLYCHDNAKGSEQKAKYSGNYWGLKFQDKCGKAASELSVQEGDF